MTSTDDFSEGNNPFPKPKGKRPLTLEELAARLEKVEAENKRLKAKRSRPPRHVALRNTERVVDPKAEPLPPEFEGLSDESCCDACGVNGSNAVEAQRKLNELELRYPRRPSPDIPVLDPNTGARIGTRRGETVMESDAQWAARVPPDVREAFIEAGRQVLGVCVIQGGPGCAHPRKGGLSPANRANPAAVLRFNRAARALKLDKLR
jgi:hypothetical protein